MIMTSEQIIADLKLHANPQAIEGMARFGIRPAQALGVSIPTLRKMAKEIGRNHALALALWDSGIHEARILASMIDGPGLVSAQQSESPPGDDQENEELCTLRLYAAFSAAQIIP